MVKTLKTKCQLHDFVYCRFHGRKVRGCEHRDKGMLEDYCTIHKEFKWLHYSGHWLCTKCMDWNKKPRLDPIPKGISWSS